MEKFYDEYYLSKFQRFAVGKFIKDQIGNPDNQKVDRLRKWFFAKLNGKRCQPTGEMQSGCPEIIPGLRAFPWW